jgi:hypothetical protein
MHALNNLFQRPAFDAELLDQADPIILDRRRGLDHASSLLITGNWQADVLERAVENLLNLETRLVFDLPAWQASASTRPFAIVVSNGAHHVAVRRFTEGGPIIWFDSLLNEPVRMQADEFWAMIFSRLDAAAAREVISMFEVVGLNDDVQGEKTVAARTRHLDEQLLNLAVFTADPVLHQVANVVRFFFLIYTSKLARNQENKKIGYFRDAEILK